MIFSASERLTLAAFVDAGIEFAAAVLAHELRNLWVIVRIDVLTQVIKQFHRGHRLLRRPAFGQEPPRGCVCTAGWCLSC